MSPTISRVRAVGLAVAMLAALAVTEPARATVTHGAPTVIAVVEPYASNGDAGFNPYHYDFRGDQHPWGGEIDFSADPATYVTGYPTTGVTALTLDLPSAPTDDVSVIRKNADPAWSSFAVSTEAVPKMYRFPGTKIIGALRFGNDAYGGFWGENSHHGTRSAASAVGNIHGTCPECLVVLIRGHDEAVRWAQKQSWIDVVTNSWQSESLGFANGVSAKADAVVAGQTMVWAAGNGLVANANDVPQFTYTSGQRGPDWIVTVGATNHGGNLTGSGKPVDVSAQGIAYPSTGGTQANGTGSHAGTSNAAPVVAGSIAKVVQLGRDLLGDTTGGHSGGVVASGTFSCGAADSNCALDGGELTREEAENVVFHNVLPYPVVDSLLPEPPPPRVPDRDAQTLVDLLLGLLPTVPTTPVAYYYVGHGVVHGREDPAGMAVEQARFHDALAGDVAPYTRPLGEHSWMIADAKCRQLFWPSTTWTGGYAATTAPAGDVSPLAEAWDAWCTEEVVDSLPKVGGLGG